MDIFSICLLAVALLVSEVIHQIDRNNARKATDAEREQWVEERRELMTRIQHPERVPVRSAVSRSTPPDLEARRRMAQVGRAAPQRVSDGD